MGEVELRASAYLTEFSDFLYLRTRVEETNCRCAVDSAGCAVLRLGGRRSSTFLRARARLDLRLTGDWVRARLDRSVADGTGSPESLRRASAAPGVRYQRWGGEVSAATLSDDPPTFALPTEGFWMVNAYVARHFERGDRHGEVFLRARNLLDEEARLATSFLKDLAPLPGRGFELGLRFTL